jgi:hypothetical protein
MHDAYVLEWKYAPPTYIDGATELLSQHGLVTLREGKAEAVIGVADYPPDHSLRGLLHSDLEAMFLAAQVLSHERFELSKPSVVRVHPDGRRDAFLFPEGISLRLSVGQADITATDGSGRVVTDTRSERIKRRDWFLRTAVRFSGDPAVSAFLRSYSAAVNDPNNELVHLYEVRECLAKRFGGEHAAVAALGISRHRWSLLGRLANDEPIAQGRHRGRQLGALRSATSAELSEARTIAREMIDRYLSLLSPSP